VVSKGSNFEDNEIPFSLIMNWNNANPIAELRVSKETYESWGGVSTLEITITQSEMSMVSTVIPRHWLPSDIKNTLWTFDLNKNSICSNTATGARGINSVAIGPLA
jgi:hypothetical protein